MANCGGLDICWCVDINFFMYSDGRLSKFYSFMRLLLHKGVFWPPTK